VYLCCAQLHPQRVGESQCKTHRRMQPVDRPFRFTGISALSGHCSPCRLPANAQIGLWILVLLCGYGYLLASVRGVLSYGQCCCFARLFGRIPRLVCCPCSDFVLVLLAAFFDSLYVCCQGKTSQPLEWGSGVCDHSIFALEIGPMRCALNKRPAQGAAFRHE